MGEGDVYEVSMVVGETAELTVVAEGREFPVGDPLEVPAGVLCAVAGCDVEGLPGRRFVSSPDGFQSVDSDV